MNTWMLICLQNEKIPDVYSMRQVFLFVRVFWWAINVKHNKNYDKMVACEAINHIIRFAFLFAKQSLTQFASHFRLRSNQPHYSLRISICEAITRTIRLASHVCEAITHIIRFAFLFVKQSPTQFASHFHLRSDRPRDSPFNALVSHQSPP